MWSAGPSTPVGAFANIARVCDDLPMTAQTAPMKGSYVSSLFNEELAGAFSRGHLFILTPDLTIAEDDPSEGYWHCDIADKDRLTWSEKVYELFGLSAGAAINRDAVVAHYAEHSKDALERVRKFALSRSLGFLLDAEIRPEGSEYRWIRVLAVPVLTGGRVVGVHGLKRAL